MRGFLTIIIIIDLLSDTVAATMLSRVTWQTRSLLKVAIKEINSYKIKFKFSTLDKAIFDKLLYYS